MPTVPDSVDPAALAVGLGEALHAAGVPVTPERCAHFTRALRLAPPVNRERLYWTARVSFVSGREQVEAFDRVFGSVFEGLLDPANGRGDTNAPPPIGAEPDARRPPPGVSQISSTVLESAARHLSATEDGPPGDGPEQQVPLALASGEERLREQHFTALQPHELVELRRLMARLAFATPLRRTRRTQRHRAGKRLDLRRTIRHSLRSGGDPVRLARRRRRFRPRRLVLLCDISGSMEPYARAYLQLLQSAVGGAQAEAFVFATRLTRLTHALQGRNPQAAIDRAADVAPDWSSGTRIAAALRAFNDGWGRRGLARGAVVVILSDGWERDDPELVGEQMRRLRRLAHRIIWVNPRKAARGYAPLAGGMAAALPSCDAFVSGHRLAALDEVLDAIRGPRQP